ncbi:unnamed protein product [Ascophyllum nodosum]
MVRTRTDIRKEEHYLEALLKYCQQDEDVRCYMAEMSDGCDHQFGDGYSPIHLAVVMGEVQLLKELLNKEVDKEEVDAKKRTPLLLAVWYGRLPILEALLAAGANAHASDYCRPYFTWSGLRIDVIVTPLQAAAIEENREVLLAFIKHVADIDPTEPDVGGALHRLACVFEGDWMPPMADVGEIVRRIDLCVEAGAKVDLVGNCFIHRASTPLHVIASVCREVRIVKTLLRHGANPNSRNGEGFSALLLATRARVGDDIFLNADVTVLEELIAHGADVSASEDTGGSTALHFAARREFPGGVRALVGAGANVNARDKRGRTPLHEAVKMTGSVPSLMCMKLLLRGGADETLTDNNGEAPSDVLGHETMRLSIFDEYTDLYLELTRELLANAPAERAWHRRGLLLFCRAFPERVPLMTSQHHSRTGVARRTRSQAKRGFHQVLAALVSLTDESIFRMIICFI